ncbi:MAG: hypothetical protein OEY49_14835 [Candidatus Heimdallarchaeota archaeon]|nr:hypothetical protein [Candidatus Heimdallarchaeota archaeon]
MKIKLYCEKCKIYELVNIEVEEKQQNSTVPGVPTTASSGLKKYTVVHEDHSLVIDVDANGDVRGNKVVPRLNLNIEEGIKKIVNNISEYSIQNPNFDLAIRTVSASEFYRNILLNISYNLLKTIPKTKSSMLSVNQTDIVLFYGKIKIITGDTTKRLDSFKSRANLVIFDFSVENFDKLEKFVYENVTENKENHYIFLHSPRLNNLDSWVKFIESINKQKINKSMFEVSDSIMAMTSISESIEKFLNEK